MRLVAELGSNHCGDMRRAKALVEAAAECGFRAVKTQSWRVSELFSSEALEARPELADRRRLEVPRVWHGVLAARARELGMGYGVTVCHAVDVRPLSGVADWLKVGSYSLLDCRLVGAVADASTPAVIGTGMANMFELKHAFQHLRKRLAPTTLLHCVSAYPADPSTTNLSSIACMRERFGVGVGWSDHTVSQSVVLRAAVQYRASMIELHFDLEDGLGVEAAHSWRPRQVKDLLEALPHIEPHAGSPLDGVYGKKPAACEMEERLWRADPSDGKRPLLELREKLVAGVT